MPNIETNPIIEPKIIGFGEHSKPINYSTYKSAKIIYDISVALLITGVAGAIVMTGLSIIPVVNIAISASAVAALAASSGAVAAGALSSVVYYKACKNSFFGVLNKIIEKMEQPIALGKAQDCDAIACEDTMESFEWKKKLIEAAEHEIVLSGNYCGGVSFDEILDLVHKQMTLKPELKVVFLSSDKFISKDNQERIDKLNKDFNNRFQLVVTPDIYHINPGFKKTTNHSKILVIDQGKYFILGGSGLEDKYALAKGLGDRENDKAVKPGGLMGWFLPRGFRDQDFIFHSDEEQGIGKRVYMESLKLALRWEGLSNLDSFTTDVDLAREFKACDSVVKNLFLSEKAKRAKPTTHIKEFHENPNCQTKCATKIYCIGPEHNDNPFEKEIINRFKQAKDRIIINHMYFHPTDAVRKALIDAANRGVKITIVTNGYDQKKSPKGHQFFGPRNRYNYCKIRNGVNPKQKKNVEVFEFKVRKTTLHKKVIVVDDYVIAGSSNLGYKSLVTMSDHEINFVTKNNEFADQTAKIARQVDAKVDYKDIEGKEVKGHARKVNNFKLDLSTIFAAARHRIVAPLVG